MALSRKDWAKIKFLNSFAGVFLKSVIRGQNIPVSQISDTVLPDDFVFDGWKVVNGGFCKTAGEYKAALQKNQSDMGGWHG